MNDQLDLFLDSQAVQFVNEIVAAFELRDAQRATTALGMLRAHAPDDAQLPTLEFLTRALTEWRAPVADLHALAAAARRLDVDIAPAAEAYWDRQPADSLAPSFVSWPTLRAGSPIRSHNRRHIARGYVCAAALGRRPRRPP